MSRPSSLLELIEDDRVHVFDGAMGTVLYAQGVFVNVCYDALALEEPELVRRVHSAYVEAGAELIETNTFGANLVKLSSYGLEDRAVEINRAAALLAVEAAGDAAFVLGSVGPLGIRMEPWGPTSRQEVAAHFGPQIEGLLEGGVDGFVLETFADPAELSAAHGAIRERCQLPVIAQMTVGDDAETVYGTPVEALAEQLTAMGADVVGLNCSVGPAAMLDALERMAHATRRPLSAQPNAGLPRTVGDRKMYMASPEYMARYARRLIDAGARFVGGCCGTTPDHIRQLAGVVAGLQPRHTRIVVQASSPDREMPSGGIVPLEERSRLGRKLASGAWVTTVELVPPKGWDASALLDGARTINAVGADAVSVVDSPGGRTRMAAIPAGLLILRETDIEPIVHYTCRDRNMLGMLSDLLGAAASGIRNLLVVSGDPPPQGPYPEPTAVFDIDSIGLTNVVAGLNRGVDPGGERVAGGPTPFVVGVAAKPGAVDLEREIRRFGWQVEAGADFAVTQPIFEPDALTRFLDRTTSSSIPLIVGVWPLTSLRSAEYLAHEVPVVVVPSTVLKRMRHAQGLGAAAAKMEGVEIACEVVEALRKKVQGVHVSAPSGAVDSAIQVLERVRAADTIGAGAAGDAGQAARTDL